MPVLLSKQYRPATSPSCSTPVAYRAMQAMQARFIDFDVAGKPLGSIELSASNIVTKMPAGKDPKAAFAFGVCSNLPGPF